jgi:hypothetical protein
MDAGLRRHEELESGICIRGKGVWPPAFAGVGRKNAGVVREKLG